MYSKKVLILTELNNSYAIKGQHICGMVRLVCNNKQDVDVTTFVTNVDTSKYGQWWLVVVSSGEIFTHKLQTMNNCHCVMPIEDINNVACVIARLDNDCNMVCCATLGNGSLDGLSGDRLYKLLTEGNETTRYEEFVAATDNYYQDVTVDNLVGNAQVKYKLIDDYSNAFERYYAVGKGDNYYDSVKGEITRLFVQFPPYYPLINKYKDSFFVRIDFVGSDRYFVMGLLQKEGQVKYICYGLPANKSMYEDKDFCFIDGDNGGYYMLFQDALTGQITTLTQ